MRTEGPPQAEIAASLAHRAGPGASASQLAQALFDIWSGVDAALAPVLGPRAVSALFQRAVYLTSAAHPWLSVRAAHAPPALDPAALQALLAGQDAEHALAAGSTFLRTFDGLLVSLIGPSLTERLLRSVWAPHSSGPAAQEPAP